MTDMEVIRRIVVIRQQLLAAGVRLVTAEYSGSGDSGQMDTIDYWGPENSGVVSGSRAVVDISNIKFQGFSTHKELTDEIEELFWEKDV